MMIQALLPGAVAFAAAALVSLLLTPAIRDFAIRRQYVDVAGSVRKIHTRSVPRLGGVAIFLSWLIAACALVLLNPSLRDVFWSKRPRTLVFILGGLAAAALGCIDDVRHLRARYKLAAQLAIGLGLCWAGFTVHEVQLPGGMVLALGSFGVPLTVLWIAGVMNAMNLIDGLDGLAAGVAAIALSAVFIFAVLAGKPLLAVLSAALVGAVIGFLFFNFNPASIFMGDAGSLLLGFFLSVALLRSSRPAGSERIELLVPVLVLGVPLCDMVMAVWRRVLRGKGLFSPDREHLHHRLLLKGLSQRQAVYILYAGAGLLAVAGIAARIGDATVDIVVAVIVALAVVFLISRMRQPISLDALRRERQRNHQLRTAVADIVGQLESATALDDVIETMQHLPPMVSAAAVRTHIGGIATDYGSTAEGAESLKLRFALLEGRRRFGHLEIAWDDGRAQIEADHALAIEEICENVVRAMRRLRPQIVDDLAPPALARDSERLRRAN
jgi:UDP-GlcNAc:undecaprenyl-phosphate/decaprenyl-phosphate GlcNAc-1-phosphate transferase